MDSLPLFADDMEIVKRVLAAVVTVCLAIVACTTPNPVIPFNKTDTQNVSTESVAESYMLEMEQLVDAITFNIGDTTWGTPRTDSLIFLAGSLTKWDKRLACAKVTVISAAGNTTGNPQGLVIIYYDSTTTCTDTAGVQRMGSIRMTYSGLRYNTNSTRVLEFKDYTRNGLRIIGTDTIINVTTISSSADTSAMAPLKFLHKTYTTQLFFTDNTAMSRDQDVTIQWTRGATRAHDTFSLLTGGSAIGETREKIIYKMTILSDLIYSNPCALGNDVFTAIQGTKTLELDTTKTYLYTIDYGNSACDNLVTININNESESVLLSPTGN